MRPRWCAVAPPAGNRAARVTGKNLEFFRPKSHGAGGRRRERHARHVACFMVSQSQRAIALPPAASGVCIHAGSQQGEGVFRHVGAQQKGWRTDSRGGRGCVGDTPDRRESGDGGTGCTASRTDSARRIGRGRAGVSRPARCTNAGGAGNTGHVPAAACRSTGGRSLSRLRKRIEAAADDKTQTSFLHPSLPRTSTSSSRGAPHPPRCVSGLPVIRNWRVAPRPAASMMLLD
jgi:hypothetical protein